LGAPPVTGRNPNYDAFMDGFSKLGWVDGQTLTLHSRFAEGRTERIPDLVDELIRLPIDVLLSSGAAGAVAAAKVTSTLPIIFASAADPIEEGLVCSLARPCANVTGVSNLAEGLDGKRLQLLQESIVGLTRVGVLWHQPSMLPDFRRTEAAAQAMGIEPLSMAVVDGDGIPGAFQAAMRDGVQAVVTVSNGLTSSARSTIVELASRHRLPAMYQNREFVAVDGLMSYGPNAGDQHRRAAGYVDKILKGAKPADLPVEQPTLFDFVVNLKAAQALGLTISPSVLQQATELIQ
ncbi:MAG TPA: ABC transporter substrate-binding protein, partial [Chloroflexota bacterium]|nr:ABC transporter substrate-binding protein [Chloroflexota bacterium]